MLRNILGALVIVPILVGCATVDGASTHDTAPIGTISTDQGKLISDEVTLLRQAVLDVGQYDVEGPDAKDANKCHARITATPSSFTLSISLAKTNETDLTLGGSIPTPIAVVTPQLAYTHKIASTQIVKLPINVAKPPTIINHYADIQTRELHPIPKSRSSDIATNIRQTLDAIILSYIHTAGYAGDCELSPQQIVITATFDVQDTGSGQATFTSIVTGSGKGSVASDNSHSIEIDYKLTGSQSIVMVDGKPFKIITPPSVVDKHLDCAIKTSDNSLECTRIDKKG